MLKTHKKIIFISNNWLKDNGGRRKVVTCLLNNLSLKENPFEYTLIDLEIGEKKENFSKIESGFQKDIKFIPIFQPRILKVIFPLAKILQKESPDLIINISASNIKAISFFIAKFLNLKTRCILIDHEPVQKLIPLLKHQLFNKILIRLTYKYADKVISVSKEQSEQTKKYFNLKNGRVLFIYNPFDLTNISQKAKEKIEHIWFEEKKYPIVVTVSRLDPMKDLPTLLRAFVSVLKEKPARLVIIGEGPQKKELENLAKELGISENIWFTGYQENPYKFMAKSDVFVLSSKFEAFPTVLIEAMRCNIPIISTDCDFGPKEILENGENGILVPVGNVEKMAKAILLLLNNQKLSQYFIEKGKRKVSEFGIERSVAEYEKIIKEILNL